MPESRDVANPRPVAVEIIRRLTDAGHVAYLAGGCVRDTLLSITPKDYDIATDAPPHRVRELFRGARFVGEAFGVALVKRRGIQVEVATFRTDAGYSDGRRPDAVTFTDAEHDAHRRDFTINGLFATPRELLDDNAQEDRIIDFVGGIDDLRAGVIRAIGDPDRRFGEDYLRMLRAVRFTARFGFRLNPVTADAIARHAPNLAAISRERIGTEIEAMLMGHQPWLALDLLRKTQLDEAIFSKSFNSTNIRGLSAPSNKATFPTRLAAWITGLTPAVTPQAARQALCLSNESHDALVGTLRDADILDRWEHLSTAQQKRLLADPYAFQAMLLRKAQRRGDPWFDNMQLAITRLENDGIGISPPPLLTGTDLIAAGLPPGPRFKPLLDAAYDAQLDGRVRDKPAALKWVMQPPPSKQQPHTEPRRRRRATDEHK